MNNDQLNDFEMYERILALLKEETRVVTKYGEFGVYIPQFEGSIVKTKKLNKDYNDATKGLTEAKHQLLDAIYAGTVPVKKALYSISHKLSDEKLKALVSITNSEFKKQREEKFIESANGMVKAARNNLASLTGFNITQEKLDALQLKLDNVALKKDEQGTGFSNRNALWKSLNNELSTIHEILTIHLDAIAECTREEDMDFYNKYTAARVIIDRGGGRGGNDEGDGTPPPEPPK